MDPLNLAQDPLPVFDIENTDSSTHNQRTGSPVNVATPHQHGARTEQKLSLSKYESVRSRSTSGERTPTDPEQRRDTVPGTSEAGHVEAVVRMESREPDTRPPGPSTSTPLRPSTAMDRETAGTNIECSPVPRRDTGDSSIASDGSYTRGGNPGPSAVSNRGDHPGPGALSSRGGNSTIDYRYVKVPVIGFEVMEQRSRFTVFQLHVQNGENDNWFVFRRYSDFVRLQHKLKVLFPMLRLALPPKRWFKDNFDEDFLDDRRLGLQAFIDSVLCLRDLYTSKPVQQFFCFNDPPGPHDSLEESRAYCEELEESMYSLKKVIREKDTELDLLRDELSLYKSQVEMLSRALRESNVNGATMVNSHLNTLPSPANSLAECDLLAPEADQSQLPTQTRDKRLLLNGSSRESSPSSDQSQLPTQTRDKRLLLNGSSRESSPSSDLGHTQEQTNGFNTSDVGKTSVTGRSQPVMKGNPKVVELQAVCN